jgi:hypothetical protein
MGSKFRIAMGAGSTLMALFLAVGLLPASEAIRSYTAEATGNPADKTNGPEAAVATGTPAAVLDDQEVEGVLGKSIRSSTGDNMGRIVDVIVTRSGRVRAAVIDFGGFLGVGSRKIAVDWNALRFNSGEKPSSVSLDLTKDQVRVAPEYKPGEPVVVLGAATPSPSLPTPPAGSPATRNSPAAPEK